MIERRNPLKEHSRTNFNVEDETQPDETVKPVVWRDANHERSMLNEVDIDFRVPVFPHSIVKQVENSRVRESRRSRTTFTDILFNTIYNKTKPTTRTVRWQSKWFRMGNVEFFELFETDPKTQCTECLSYWSAGIVVMHHQNWRFCGQGWLIRYDARRAVEIHAVFFYLSA